MNHTIDEKSDLGWEKGPIKKRHRLFPGPLVVIRAFNPLVPRGKNKNPQTILFTDFYWLNL